MKISKIVINNTNTTDWIDFLIEKSPACGRIKAGTVGAAAKITGKSVQQIKNYKSGRCSPPINLVFKWAKSVGFSEIAIKL